MSKQDDFMPDTRMFLQRLVEQDTIMQQTAAAILMCVDRDVARALQRLEIATVERLEKKYIPIDDFTGSSV